MLFRMSKTCMKILSEYRINFNIKKLRVFANIKMEKIIYGIPENYRNSIAV